MMNRSEIRRRVQALKQGDVVHVDTNVIINDQSKN